MTAFMPSSSFNSIFSPDAYESSSSSFASPFFSSSSHHSSFSTSNEQPNFSAFFPSISSVAEQLRSDCASDEDSSASSASPATSHTSVFSLPSPSAEVSPTQEEMDFLAAFGSRPLDEADELFLDSGYTVNDLPLPYAPDAFSPPSNSSNHPITVPFESMGAEYDLFAPDLLKSGSSASHATSSNYLEDDFDYFNPSELLAGSLETYDPFSLGIMVHEQGVVAGMREPSWLQDLVQVKEEEEESCAIQGWSEDENETVKIVVKSEEDGDQFLLQGWSGEEVYVPTMATYLPCSSHASTSTNDTYLLPHSPPPVISSLQPPRVPHRSRSIPSLSTSQSPSSASAYRRKLLPAKPSLPVLRENFRATKEDVIDNKSEFSSVGGYGGQRLGMGREWESRTTGSELYGGFQTMQDISRRFSSDHPASKYAPSTPAYQDPSQFAQPPALHVYTVQTSARLQASSPVPPSPPPFHASPLNFSPTIMPSCLEPSPHITTSSRRSDQEEKDASTSRRSQSLTSPPPSPVLVSAPTAQSVSPPKRPFKSPARALNAVPTGIAAAGSIVAAQKATDDAKRAAIKAESAIRQRTFDAIAATTLSTVSSRSNAALPPSPPSTSSPVELKRRPAARRPAPPPPSSNAQSGGNKRVWGFVNYTFADAHELLTGVAATGPKLGGAGKRRRDDDDDEEEKPVGKKGKKARS